MEGLRPWRNHEDAIEAKAHATDQALQFRQTAKLHTAAGNTAMAHSALRIAQAFEALSARYGDDVRRLAAAKA